MQRLETAASAPSYFRKPSLSLNRNAKEKTQKQREQAYAALRRLLILRRIPEGERLRELVWVKRLSVNRTALREALSRLSAEGVIVEGEKTGYFVPRFTGEELQQIRDVRLMIESAAIQSIVGSARSRTRDLQLLRELCNEVDWMLERDYEIELVEADHRFHEALVRLTGNERLERIHRCLPHAGEMKLEEGRSDWLSAAGRMVADHRDIIDAVNRRQAAEAVAILTRHYAAQAPASVSKA